MYKHQKIKIMSTDKKYNHQINTAPNTGELFKTYFKQKRIRKAALARFLNRSVNTLSTYIKNDTIQTAVLWELCHALKHNFFADIAAQLPSTYTSNVSIDDSKDLRIAQLENELAISKAKYEALAEVMKGK